MSNGESRVRNSMSLTLACSSRKLCEQNTLRMPASTRLRFAGSNLRSSLADSSFEMSQEEVPVDKRVRTFSRMVFCEYKTRALSNG